MRKVDQRTKASWYGTLGLVVVLMAPTIYRGLQTVLWYIGIYI
jgi:hypothetical protein